MAGYFNTGDDEVLVKTIRVLQNEVKALKARAFVVPTLEEDPDASSANNLWMLADGRLRGRKPDGTIVEYATTTSGSGDSAEGFPTEDYEPSSYIYGYDADWQQSYKNGGLSQYNNPAGRMFFGGNSNPDGEYVSMMHFPNLSELAPGPEGIAITEALLYLDAPFTYLEAGVTVTIGLHNSTLAPAAFAEDVASSFEAFVIPGAPNWHTVPLTVAQQISAGTWTGFTIHQGTSARSAHGYIDTAKLRVSYSK